MKKRYPEITDQEYDFVAILIRHRGRAYRLRVKIDYADGSQDHKLRTCQHCGAQKRGQLSRCTIDVVHCEIENEGGSVVVTDATSHFGKILINKARRQARAWLCRTPECYLTCFEVD